MRIALVISSLSGGGAGRILSLIANYWAKAGHKITLLTFDDEKYPFYQLDNTVQLITLNIVSDSTSWLDGLTSNLKRIYYLRKAISHSKSDFVISFLYTTNILVLIATRLLSCAVIISERSDPRYSKEKRLTWFWLRRFLYPMADHLVVQNHEIKDWFTGYNNSIQIIPNPVEIPSENLKSTPEISLPMGKLLVAMGRMVKLKGFDILIEIFARLHKNHKDWNLLIIGTGHLEEVLKQQTKQLGIKEYVYFPGKIVNPFSVLVHCDLFVLSSLYEGFPNALLEAMACGLPVISFDCPSGPSEIIQNEINGLLVPAENKDALEKALDKMMQNEELRKKLGRQAIKVYDKYTPKKIMPMWEKLLSKNL